MALIVNTSEKKTYKYIPIIERNAEKPFSVTIKKLTPKEYTYIDDKMARINQDQSISFTTGSYNWEIAKRGIVGWENLIDGDGKEIKPIFTDVGLTDESLNYIPFDIITEIANVIIGITKDPENADLYLGIAQDEVNEET